MADGQHPGRGIRRRISPIVAASILVAVAAAGAVLARRHRGEPAEAGRAREAVAASRDADALPMIEGWIRARPADPEPHFLGAEASLRLGDVERAARFLEEARRLGSRKPDLDRLSGLLLARTGRGEVARPLLEEAWSRADGLRADPEVADALAKLAMQQFDLDRAGEVLERWSRESPRDPRPLLWLAEIDRRRGAGAETVSRRFREALDRDAACPAALIGLADCEFALGRYPEAAEKYVAYAALRPDDPSGPNGLGLIAGARGEADRAIEHFDRALNVDPENTLALKKRAEIELGRGRADAARPFSDRAVTADPYDPELRYQRSQILSRIGATGEAAEERARADRLRREHRRFAEIQEALVASPRDPELCAEAAGWMMEHGRTEEGIVWAKMVLQDQPAHPGANRILADHYAAIGQNGLANHYRLHAGEDPGTASLPAGRGSR